MNIAIFLYLQDPLQRSFPPEAQSQAGDDEPPGDQKQSNGLAALRDFSGLMFADGMAAPVYELLQEEHASGGLKVNIV